MSKTLKFVSLWSLPVLALFVVSCACQHGKTGTCGSSNAAAATETSCPHKADCAGCPHNQDGQCTCPKVAEGQCPHKAKADCDQCPYHEDGKCTCPKSETGECPHAKQGECPKAQQTDAPAGECPYKNKD